MSEFREITGYGVRASDGTNLCSGFCFKDLKLPDDQEIYCEDCSGCLSCIGCPHNPDSFEKDFNDELGTHD